MCVHSATRHNIYIYPYFLFAVIHHLNRPHFSQSNLVAHSAENGGSSWRLWVRFPTRSRYFFFTSYGSLIPLTRANARWVIHGLNSTLIYTSKLILCFSICVYSATRHNIQFYVYQLRHKSFVFIPTLKMHSLHLMHSLRFYLLLAFYYTVSLRWLPLK